MSKALGPNLTRAQAPRAMPALLLPRAQAPRAMPALLLTCAQAPRAMPALLLTRAQAPRAMPALLLPVLLLLLGACSFELDYDKHAVVVGVADYPGTADDLNYPDDDARDMRDLLVSQGFQVTMLVTDNSIIDPDEATFTNLQAAFAATAAIVKEEDLFLFYFSGHGSYALSGSPDITENASGSDPYEELILLVNATLTNVYAYSDDALAADLRTIPCRKRIVIIDACFSGGFIGNRLEVDGVPPSLYEGDDSGVFSDLLYAINLYANFNDSTSDIDPSTALVIAASGEREASWEGYGEHGVMTYFLLRSALYGDRNGDGYITVLEAYNYIRGSIRINWNLLVDPWDAFSPHTSGGPVDYVLFTR